MNKEAEKLASPGSSRIPYKAVEGLKSGEQGQQWDPSEMFPTLTDVQITEKMPDFFNNISREFQPLSEPDLSLIHI